VQLAPTLLPPAPRAPVVRIFPPFGIPHDVAIVQGLNIRDAETGLCPNVIGCCATTSRRYGSRFGKVSMSMSARSGGRRRSGTWVKNSVTSISPRSEGTVLLLLIRLVGFGLRFSFPWAAAAMPDADAARSDQANKFRFFLEKSRE